MSFFRLANSVSNRCHRGLSGRECQHEVKFCKPIRGLPLRRIGSRGATRGGQRGQLTPPPRNVWRGHIGGGARFGDGARFGGGARSDINHPFVYFFLVGARSLQSFCSKYRPAPVINVVEDLFSQHFFFEGSVLTASAGAHSSS